MFFRYTLIKDNLINNYNANDYHFLRSSRLEESRGDPKIKRRSVQLTTAGADAQPQPPAYKGRDFHYKSTYE